MMHQSAWLPFVSRGVDIAGVVLAAMLAHYVRFDSFSAPLSYQFAIILGVLLTPIIFGMAGVYTSWRGRERFEHARAVSMALLTVFALLVIIAFITKTSTLISRQWFSYWVVFALAIVLLLRGIVFYMLSEMRRRGMNRKTVAVVGAGVLGRDVVEKLRENSWAGLNVVAFFDDDEKRWGGVEAGVPLIGSPNTLVDYLQSNHVDEIWVALPLRAELRVRDILYQLRHSTVTIRYVPDIFSFRLLNHAVSEVAGIPLLDISATPMMGVNKLVKGLEDRVLALGILVLISPLLAVIALAIKWTSPGPVIFKQLRHGWDGKPVKIYKFRTMVVHQPAAGAIVQATRGDPRVTRFGGWLRRSSLDELPQFFNVLQGRMSIVGPRPHAIEHNEYYKDMVEDYMRRHKVKPGITGWAQVNGWRGETDTLEKMKKRVEFDLYYIEHWSLWFDLKIIWLTLYKGFAHKHAY